jgi:hypothetical protein
MTDHDKDVLLNLSEEILAWKFPHPMNTQEGGQVLHDVSALLIKVSNHIKAKVDGSNRKDN